MIDFIKEYWRIIIMVLLVGLSLSLIFGVIEFGEAGSDETDELAEVEQSDSLTTLQFGLELDGGTRITTPLHGQTAEGVDIRDDSNQSEIESSIASHIDNVPESDVSLIVELDQAGNADSSIEVTSETVTQSELETALDTEGIEYDSVRSGVTDQTRERTVEIINNKINESGLSGGTARSVQSATGESFILIEVPGADRDSVISILEDRGDVQIDLYYPQLDDDGDVEYIQTERLLDENSFQRVGTATEESGAGPHVPVTLTQSSAVEFRDGTMASGMVPGGSRCTYDDFPGNTEACLLTIVDGEVVYSAGMSPNLATSIEGGDWTNSPNFILQTESLQEAQQLSLHLSAGSLPTALNFDAGTSIFISPSQGEHFQISSIIIALLAIGGVTTKVFYRYRDIRVAAPMVVTSISEVVILLGFAAFIGYPIDLAVIGGFIAVIGTGVDDLIIIANEVLSKGDVNSKKVFDSRFSKAFWIIMAAAITTIIALSPLIVLSLGELQGFAIFTIIGILIGISITRPAYGNILSYLLTDQNEKYNKK